MRNPLTIELQQMVNTAFENVEASSTPTRRKNKATNQVGSVASPLKVQQDLFANDGQEVNSFLELSRQSRHFNERMLIDTTMIIGRGRKISIVVQPSESVGYAHVSTLHGEECTWTKRPIRRDAVPAMIESQLPKDVRISWEFIVSAQRVCEPLFKMVEVSP